MSSSFHCLSGFGLYWQQAKQSSSHSRLSSQLLQLFLRDSKALPIQMESLQLVLSWVSSPSDPPGIPPQGTFDLWLVDEGSVHQKKNKKWLKFLQMEI